MNIYPAASVGAMERSCTRGCDMTREEAMRNIEEVANFLDNRGMSGAGVADNREGVAHD